MLAPFYVRPCWANTKEPIQNGLALYIKFIEYYKSISYNAGTLTATVAVSATTPFGYVTTTFT